MMQEHYPVLQVLVPLLLAPLCIFTRSGRAAWGFALLGSWGALYFAIMLFGTVMETGPISYALGDWVAPFGIEYRVDSLNAFILLIVSGIGALVVPFTRSSLLLEMVQEKEFAASDRGYTFASHQQEVGAGYFDDVTTVIQGGQSSVTALTGSTEEEQFDEAAHG